MNESTDKYEISPEQAREMVDEAFRDMDINGYYQAICPCGEICAINLENTCPEPSQTIACPACDRVGDKDGIRWEYCAPLLERDQS